MPKEWKCVKKPWLYHGEWSPSGLLNKLHSLWYPLGFSTHSHCTSVKTHQTSAPEPWPAWTAWAWPTAPSPWSRPPPWSRPAAGGCRPEWWDWGRKTNLVSCLATQFQQSFPCHTVSLVWLVLGAREIPYGSTMILTHKYAFKLVMVGEGWFEDNPNQAPMQGFKAGAYSQVS